MKISALAFALIIPTLSNAGSFSYDLYQVSADGRTLIESKTIDTQELKPKYDAPSSTKSQTTRRVTLGNGYSIGCSDYGEKNPSGLGCWLRRNRSSVTNDQYEGFSWEWYDQGMGSLYSKRQGKGRISVQVHQVGSAYAIQKIKFLDETTFRLNMKPQGESDGPTHEMVIKAESELPLLQQFPQ